MKEIKKVHWNGPRRVSYCNAQWLEFQIRGGYNLKKKKGPATYIGDTVILIARINRCPELLVDGDKTGECCYVDMYIHIDKIASR